MFWIKRNVVREKSVWHKWFAWFPVAVGVTPDGDFKKVWLQTVMRCGTLHHWYDGPEWEWAYKTLEEHNGRRKTRKV